jgi:hypothetical protein
MEMRSRTGSVFCMLQCASISIAKANRNPLRILAVLIMVQQVEVLNLRNISETGQEGELNQGFI